jgi:hypothetical protein
VQCYSLFPIFFDCLQHFDVLISHKKIVSDNDITNTLRIVIFKKSLRLRIIKNVIYLISLLEFFIHYILAVEMGIKKILRHYSPSIELCQLLIKQYMPFNLSQMNFCILCLSILTLLFSTEAVRKSSLFVYRIYIVIKFIFVIGSLFLCTINAFNQFKNTFYSYITLILILIINKKKFLVVFLHESKFDIFYFCINPLSTIEHISSDCNSSIESNKCFYK